MKKILFLFATLLFLNCSSDDEAAVRKLTFKVNGVSKVYKDIRVTSYNDTSFEIPYTRLQITARPEDGSPETFSVVVNRGGENDGQSRNGGAFINGKAYNYNFGQPLLMNLSINTDKRIKGTFEGIYTNEDGENIQFTNGRIDITYYPDNGTFIKR